MNATITITVTMPATYPQNGLIAEVPSPARSDAETLQIRDQSVQLGLAGDRLRRCGYVSVGVRIA